ncbi:MAG: hypothetical protein E6Q33_06765 [Neisseriales bacterium]|mgnify:CR=1 FL=1|nr:MAG: hypothetical protein E6Q33_06765 [Neisseriales bacterium]
MSDPHTLSMVTLILTIVGTVLGSSVLSAIITGLFNSSNKNNEWRSQHLSQDKEKIREECMKIFNNCQQFNLKETIDKIINEEDSAKFITALNSSFHLIELYLDTTNIKSSELRKTILNLIEDFNKLMCIQNAKDIKENSEVGAIERAIFNKLLHNEIPDKLGEFKKIVREYFVEYYPKPAVLARIKQSLCGK